MENDKDPVYVTVVDSSERYDNISVADDSKVYSFLIYPKEEIQMCTRLISN